MKREEFMLKLESLLQDISKEEREEALQYYKDYFDDAGAENEDSIIKELGSPEKVAKTLKEDIGENPSEDSEYSEMGYNYSSENTGNAPAVKKKPWTNDTLKIILIVLIIIVGTPIIMPIAAVPIAVLVAIAAVIFGFLVSGIVIGIVGISMIVLGISKIPVAAALALGFSGTGLLLVAAGAALSVLIWKLVSTVVPKVFRWAVELVKKLFHKEG